MATLRARWLWRTVVWVLLGIPMLAVGPFLLVATARHGHLLYDFRGGLYNAGAAILHGVSPYRPAFLAHQAAIMRHGGIALGETDKHPFSIPVYPAFVNVLVVPLSLLPFAVSGVLFTLLGIAAMWAGLRLLGVRDWRCLALALGSWPFLFGVYLGAVGPFLVLGIGAAWRWRDRVWPPACAVAAIVAMKIFPWTLGVWMLVTRRWRALLACIGIGALMLFGAWAVIGFDGLLQYPRMLSEMSFLQEGRADSVVTVLLVAGVSPGAATAVAMMLALAVLGLAWRLAGGDLGDRRAFGLVILAALTSTPIVWEHYMVLLFVPIAMISPSYSPLWLGPLVVPALWAVSMGPIDDSHKLQAYSPDALRTAIPYLILQMVIGVALATDADQRRAWRRSLRPVSRRELSAA